MKIATFNVNGISSRLPNLLRWLNESKPDIACLQELKTIQEKFPLKEINQEGYEAIWHGQKSWNGVAILSKVGAIKEITRALPGDPDDLHSRYLEAVINGITIACLYLPNGNPYPGPKFEYKQKWFLRLLVHAQKIINKKFPAVIAGDFNVMPTEMDVYKPERWVNDALFRIEIRDAYQQLLSQGWTDSLRHMHSKEVIYTFWDYFRNAYGRNAGLRIDHLLISPQLKKKLIAAEVDHHVRGWEKPSDHAPVWIQIK